MANMMDYIDWRGDLPLQASPFNEVDNLILSQLSYVDFADIVPAPGSGKSITIASAAELYFSKHTEQEVLDRISFTKLSPLLLKKMGESCRFGHWRLSNYVDSLDYQKVSQFSALHITAEDDSIYVAFRGTDDTLLGWKEDFHMSFIQPVPSQLEAVIYLENTLAPGNIPLRLGGHSKGGNLAVYSAVNCNATLQGRILAVYNNDGPGFDQTMLNLPAYEKMLPKIHTFVPESSVVGMLLEHEEAYYVVRSKQIGLLQHDAMSWQVLGSTFIYAPELSENSKFMDKAIKTWVNGLDNSQREAFVEALFGLLEGTKAVTVADLSVGSLKHMTAMVRELKQMDEETKDILFATLKALVDANGKVLKMAIAKKTRPVQKAIRHK